METQQAMIINVKRDEKELIKSTAALLGMPEEKYLIYLGILADRETWDRYHISARNQELGWEDFCEYSEEELAVYHEVRQIVRENSLEGVIAKNLKVVKHTFINGQWNKAGEEEYLLSL